MDAFPIFLTKKLDTSLFTRKVLPVYLQSEITECGLACIGMIASYWGKTIDLPALRRRFPVSIQGATLNDLIRYSDKLGFKAHALKADLDRIPEVRLPAILHWEFNHFVVLKRITRHYAVIHDPGAGERKVSLPELSKSFTGVVLEVLPGSNFKPENVKTTISLRDILRGVSGLGGPLLQTLALSIGIQLVVLAIPIYTQLAIDEVIPTGDEDLLFVIAMGFSIVYAIGPLLEWLRQRLVIYLSVQFSAQMTANVVGHLLALPLSFFESRSIGDTLARLEASDRLRDLLTQGFVTVIVDIVLAVATLCMMYYLSSSLGLIVTAATVIVVGLRLAFIPELRRLVNEMLLRKGLEQSEIIESLRGIPSIKIFQKESEREAIWKGRFVSYLNSVSLLQSLQANYDVMKSFLINITNVLLIYYGTKLVIDIESSFTVGAFVAFAAYRQLFFERLNSFLDILLEFSMSKVHLERLGEVLSESKEKTPSEFHRNESDRLQVRFDGVSFRFEGSHENVLEHVNVTLTKGDRVVLTGPSGSGKTTLLKLFAGIHTPLSGTIYLNDIDVAGAGLKILRSQVATVLQGDYLFKGSIIENITFFDRVPNVELAMQCAELACIDQSIQSMPMSYETLIGEMGTSLSQGQQQRVLLARALYQQKPLLILDEGTAHLDEKTEQAVLNNLRKIGVTLILTVHKHSLVDFGTAVWTVTDMNRLTVVEPGYADDV